MADEFPAHVKDQLVHATNNNYPSFEIERTYKTYRGLEKADCVVLEQRFCLQNIQWHMLFDSSNYDLPPDILFGPEDENFQPLMNLKDSSSNDALVKILLQWNSRDRTQLLKLLLQLREMYLQYHKTMVDSILDQRVKFEISTVAHIEGLESYLEGRLDKASAVYLCVPLRDLDFTRLHALVSGGSLHNTFSPIFLQVKFELAQQTGNGRNGAPDVTISAPKAALDLLSFAQAQMPPWADETCLVDYLPILQNQIQQQLETAVVATELRIKFMRALPTILGRPLEMDTVLYQRSSFVVAFNKSTLLVHIRTPVQFPKQQPSIQIQSPFNFDGAGVPITSRAYDEYPWSPRWDIDEMLRRIRNFLQEELGEFQAYCSEGVKQ